ncbi:MAG TPA: hypothetical protein VF297_23810 [Pyrinomonadaceae bacterium]
MSKTASFPGEAANGTTTTRRAPLSGTLRRAGIYFGVALFVFLLGLVPMWLKAREASGQRDAARRELRLSRTQGTLASAAIDARRGEYETARQTASDFFTTLRGELDAGEESPLNARQRTAAAPLLASRDDIITLLARSDPAAADRLSDLYVSYRAAVNDVPLK